MICLNGVTKWLGGRKVIDCLSLQVQDGEVFGLLGPNGAGKTTTLRLITGLVTPDEGHVTVAGVNVHSQPLLARSRLGVLLSEPGLYDRLTALENILIFAEMNGLYGKWIRIQAMGILERLQIGDSANRLVGTFSKGMRQKVAIARAVIHQPPVIILDEPTVGLDVFSALTIEELIKEFRAAGQTVVFSTHIMNQVERLCDRICILNHGRKFMEGTLPEVSAGLQFEDAFVRALTTTRAEGGQ
jgi:sodium transport system ATP-binding protein